MKRAVLPETSSRRARRAAAARGSRRRRPGTRPSSAGPVGARSWRRPRRPSARANGGRAAMPSIAAIRRPKRGELARRSRVPLHGHRDRLGDVARVVALDVLVRVVRRLARRHRLGARAGEHRSTAAAPTAASSSAELASATATGRRITPARQPVPAARLVGDRRAAADRPAR